MFAEEQPRKVPSMCDGEQVGGGWPHRLRYRVRSGRKRGILRPRRIALIVVLAVAGGGLATLPASRAVDDSITVTWVTRERTMADGRTFFTRVPTCTPKGAACVEHLARPRALVVFLHAANGAEDRATATSWLAALHAIDRETIFAFAVSKDGTRRWDAGLCCTTEAVDDVEYLGRLVTDVAADWAVDRDRVGAMGLSNGGMLALRVACERPDLYPTVVALAGVYDGACDEGQVQIGQWHGAVDPTVPLNGGQVTVLGERRTLPPVAAIAQRMTAGSVFELRVIPGRGHAMSWTEYRQATQWLLAHLPTG